MDSAGSIAVSGTVPRLRRDVLAACAGNVVEWYDFAIFGALASMVGAVFFPSGLDGGTLGLAFAVYGAAFIARPVGALLFGRRGDWLGRRRVLVAVIAVMTVSTAAVGLLPGYAVVGLAAPVVLVSLRLLQGVGAGGELGVAAVFLVEQAPPGRRGTYGAWHLATLALGTAAGLAVGALVTSLAGGDPSSWWWRVAFLLALPLGLVGWWLRRTASDSAELPDRRDRVSDPVRRLWHAQRSSLMAGFALIAAGAIGFNTFFIFLPNHLASTGVLSLPDALALAVGGLVVGAVSAIAIGRLSDRVGRRPIACLALALTALGAVPMIDLTATATPLGLAVIEIVAGILISGVLAMGMLAEMFPARLRATGLAVTAGLATAVFGGTTPLIQQLLTHTSGLGWLSGLYVALPAALALILIRKCPETAFQPLR